VSADRGGLGVGPGAVSLVLAVLIALGVGYVTISGRWESAASQAVSADAVPAPAGSVTAATRAHFRQQIAPSPVGDGAIVGRQDQDAKDLACVR
jgi:hypothetical protein